MKKLFLLTVVILVGASIGFAATDTGSGILEQVLAELQAIHTLLDSRLPAPVPVVTVTPPVVTPVVTPVPPVVTPVTPPVVTVPPAVTPVVIPVTTHPILFPGIDQATLQAKIAADPYKTWKYIITAAELQQAGMSPQQISERMACSAIIYRFGLIPGFTYKLTQSGYGDQAISDFLAWDMTAANYKTTDLCVLQLALTYDWAYDRLTDAQRSSFVQAVMTFKAACKGVASKGNSAQPGWELWWGYNQLAGEFMLFDMANGDSAAIADTYNNSWWANDPNKPNFKLNSTYFPSSGNREGFGYWAVGGSPSIEVAKYAYGDQAAIALGSRHPLWLLFQTDPMVMKPFLYSLPTITYSGGIQSERIWFQSLGMHTGDTDIKMASLARWMLDQMGGFGGGSDFPSLSFLAYYVIGDPRVKGVDPGTLGIPLTFSTSNETFQRSDWTPQATVVYWGCSTYWTRVTPANDVMVWSKGGPLLCCRQQMYSHSYGCAAFRNCVSFWKNDSNNVPRIIYAPNGDEPNDYVIRGNLTGDATRLFTTLPGVVGLPPAANLISKSKRSVNYNLIGNIITVTDEIVADSSLIPMICWNMPGEPIIDNTAGSITTTNSTTGVTATLTLDSLPLKIYKIGGVDGLDGVGMDGNGQPTATPAVDNVFKNYSQADQIKHGGNWRVQIVPSNPTTVTTIVVK